MVIPQGFQAPNLVIPLILGEDIYNTPLAQDSFSCGLKWQKESSRSDIPPKTSECTQLLIFHA